ncbi:hypothetical protein V7F62_21150, partial [Salmonella enterica subsp. enterica serovar Enteritidis]
IGEGGPITVPEGSEITIAADGTISAAGGRHCLPSLMKIRARWRSINADQIKKRGLAGAMFWE